MRRPVVVLAVIVTLCICIAQWFFPDAFASRYRVLEEQMRGNEKLDVCVLGTVTACVQSGENDRITIQNVKVMLQDRTYSVPSLILFSKKKISCAVGDEVYAKGSLVPTEEIENPGQFSYAMYYLSQNAAYICWCEQLQVKEGKGLYYAYRKILVRLKQKMQKVYAEHLSVHDAGIVSAMVLGEKQQMEKESKDLYQSVGIGHVLAISGLHIMVLGTFFWKVCKSLSANVPLCVGLTLCFLLSYLWMTGVALSTKRAVIMMFFLYGSILFHRSYDRLTALAASAVWILIQAPYSLFSAGFLLSFTAVLGIETVYPALTATIGSSQKKKGKNKRKWQRLQKQMRAFTVERRKKYKGFSSYVCDKAVWVRQFRLFIRFFKLWAQDKIEELFLQSLGIEIAIIPVLAYFYYQIPLYGILLNLLVLPLMGFLLGVAFLGGILGCIWLPLGAFMKLPVTAVLAFYDRAAAFFKRLPGHMYTTGQPQVWKLLCYYGFLLLFVLCTAYSIEKQRKSDITKQHKKQRHTWQRILLLLPLLCLILPQYPKRLRVCFLSVGQGDAIVLETKKGSVFLIDGGSSNREDLEEDCLTPYLLSQGITKIDYALVTHTDKDHISGVEDLLAKSDKGGVKVANLLLPSISSLDASYQNLEREADLHGVQVSYVSQGDEIAEGDMHMHCLHPNKNFATDDKNAYSAVWQLHLGKAEILLTGDLPGEEEKAVAKSLLENREEDDYISILKCAHHGSRFSSTEEFLQAAAPDVAVISCGKNNRYGHPHEETLARIEKTGAMLYRTDRDGAVNITLEKGKIKIEKIKTKNPKCVILFEDFA